MTREDAIKILSERYSSALFSERTALKTLIPELAESDDEKIRQGMIRFLNSEKAKGIFTYEARLSWIAYLEKQKEQIPYIDFAIKPHKGDDTNPYDMSVSEAQDYASNRGFDVPFNDGEVYVDERHITQTIGNILRWADEHPKEHKPAEWSEEDEETLNSCISSIEESKENRYAYKENDGDTSYDREIAWLKSLKDRGNFPKSNTNSPSEWSEEDEKMMNLIKTQLRILQSHLSHAHSKSMSDMEYSSRLLQIEKCVSWLDIRLKSLRPQSQWEIYQTGKHDLAIRFMNYLNENRPKEKMSLSNGECEGIDKAFKENDWAKILRYAKKYQTQSEQKPEAKLTGWVTRDINEEVWVHIGRKSFPDLKWEDEPVEVEVTIRRK